MHSIEHRNNRLCMVDKSITPLSPSSLLVISLRLASVQPWPVAIAEEERFTAFLHSFSLSRYGVQAIKAPQTVGVRTAFKEIRSVSFCQFQRLPMILLDLKLRLT